MVKVKGKHQVLEIAGRCYLRATKVNPDLSSCWHDLAINYHIRARIAQGEAEKKEDSDLVSKAFMAAKKCLLLTPRSAESWNLLGFLALNWDRSVGKKYLTGSLL